MVRAHQEIKRQSHALKLIIRSEIRLADGPALVFLATIAQRASLPVVAASGALMHEASRRRLADVVAATRLRTTVSAAGFELALIGELAARSRDFQ